MKFKGYIINLPGRNDRWASASTSFIKQKFEIQRVDAINGSVLEFPIADFDEKAYKYLHGRKPIPAEVGCYLSHIKAIKQFLKSGDEFGLILEDDAVPCEGLMEILNKAIEYSAYWDILRLSTVNAGYKLKLADLVNGYSLSICPTREKGAGAYLINRKTAEIFCKKLLPMKLSYDIAFDMEYRYGLKAMFIYPVPVSQTGFETQIQIKIGSYKYPKTRYFTVLPFRAYVETYRFLARLFYFVRLKLLGMKSQEITDSDISNSNYDCSYII